MAEQKDKIQFFPDNPAQVPPPHDPPDPLLDQQVAATFPASDPPAIVSPHRDADVQSAAEAAEQRRRQQGDDTLPEDAPPASRR
jgi:hypothetical protein